MIVVGLEVLSSALGYEKFLIQKMSVFKKKSFQNSIICYNWFYNLNPFRKSSLLQVIPQNTSENEFRQPHNKNYKFIWLSSEVPSSSVRYEKFVIQKMSIFEKNLFQNSIICYSDLINFINFVAEFYYQNTTVHFWKRVYK